MNLHNFACKEHPLVCLGSNPKSLFLPTKGNDWLRKKQCWHCWYRVIPIQPTLEQGPLFQCCFMQTWEHRFYFPLLVKRSPGKENLTFKWDSETLQTIKNQNQNRKTLVLVILADWSMEGKSFHQTNNLTNIWNCRGSGKYIYIYIYIERRLTVRHPLFQACHMPPSVVGHLKPDMPHPGAANVQAYNHTDMLC